MDTSDARAPSHSEGDGNLSPRRKDWKARNLDDAARALVDADSRYFFHQSLSTPCLSAIRKAEGIWLEDMTGRRFMDFHGNNVHHIGYGHPRLVAALKRQIDDLPFTPRRFTDEPAVALAAKLASIAPDGLGKMLFATGGSDAIEMALKLARAVTGRFKTVSFWDAFHGAGFGASSVGGQETFRSGPVGPLLPGTEHVAPPYCYRCPYGYRDIEGQPDLETCKMTCANFVRYVLEKEGDVAAVIAEPLQRCTPPVPGFLEGLRDLTRGHDVPLIFDEVVTGFRVGPGGAQGHYGVTPDLTALAKILAGGLPGGALTAIMIGVFNLHDMDIGPLIMVEAHDLVWVLFASMFWASLAILFLGIVEAKGIVHLLRIPFPILAPAILIFSTIGAYALRANILDVYTMFGAGVAGFFMRRSDYSIPAVVLGVILGQIGESNFTIAMVILDYNPLNFFTRPVPAILISLAFIMVVHQFFQHGRIYLATFGRIGDDAGARDD